MMQNIPKTKGGKKQKQTKQWGFDSNARYNEYQPEEFTKEYYEQLATNKKNAWTKHMLSKDYDYDPKMMDSRYAAMIGAKRGLKAYFGDVNDDGVPDVALVDEKGKIKNFNGFSQKQSKRRQLVNYYNQVGPIGLTKTGAPVYGPKSNFNNWVQDVAKHESQQGNLKKLNTELGHKGYVGYKLKEKTVSEIIRTAVKPAFQNLQNQISQQFNLNPTIVKRAMPYNIFISIYIRVVLNSLFNAQPQSRSDDEAGQWIAKTLKKKWNGTQFEQLNRLKDSVIGVFNQLNRNGFTDIGLAIWNGFSNGLDSLSIQVNTINQFGNNIVNSFSNIANLCRQALQTRMEMPSKKIVSNKPVPVTKRGQKRTFDPRQIQADLIEDLD